MGLISRVVLRAASLPRAGTRQAAPRIRLRATSRISLTTAVGGGHHPRPLAIEQDGTHRVAREINRVHGPVDAGQHVVDGDQGGMHADLHPCPSSRVTARSFRR